MVGALTSSFLPNLMTKSWIDSLRRNSCGRVILNCAMLGDLLITVDSEKIQGLLLSLARRLDVFCLRWDVFCTACLKDDAGFSVVL